MNEIESTERYEFRKTNLLHSYYAVNSVDGRLITLPLVVYATPKPAHTSTLEAIYQWLVQLTQSIVQKLTSARPRTLLPSIAERRAYSNLKRTPQLIPITVDQTHSRYPHSYHSTKNK